MISSLSLEIIGHSGDIHLTSLDVSVDCLLPTRRTFCYIINKCLSGKKLEWTFSAEALYQATTKGYQLKTKAKVAKSDKKKQPAKMPKAKGLYVLSKVALTEAEQLKMATKKSKTQFHISHASGSGDGVDTQSKVPDEQHLKTTGVDEGTDSGEEDDDDDGGGSDDHDDDSDDERTESDRDEIPDPNMTNVTQIEHEEEYVDERVHTPSDYELTDDEMIHDEEKIDDEEELDEEEEDEAGADQQNVSQESGFEQVEEDAYVTLTLVIDTQKTDGTMQSSSVSSDFTSKLLNLENPSPADNEIASLMETSTRHATTVPKITSGFATTIPLPPQFFNPLPHQATPTPTPTTFEATTSFPSLLDFSSVFKFNDRVTNEKDLSEIKQVDQYAQALSSIPILPQAVSDFATPVIEKNVTESLEAAVLARSSSQPKSTYEAAAPLSEFELTKMLLEKMEEIKSHLRADYKKKLYDALMTETKIETPPLDQTEGRKEGNQAKKLSHPEIQEFNTGNNDEQPADKEVSKANCQVARAKKPHTSFDELMDTSFKFSAFVSNQLNIKDLTQEILVGPAFELLKGTCKSLTELEYHLEECSKETTKRLDWHNPEGKPYPFDLSKPLPLIRDHRGR
ncbi:hypothetical protein Tco_1066060 [Tanacetum coccineum]